MCVFYVLYVSPIDLQREIGSRERTKRLSCMCSCSRIVQREHSTWVATLFLASNVKTKASSAHVPYVTLWLGCSGFAACSHIIWLWSSSWSRENHVSPNTSFSNVSQRIKKKFWVGGFFYHQGNWCKILQKSSSYQLL